MEKIKSDKKNARLDEYRGTKLTGYNSISGILFPKANSQRTMPDAQTTEKPKDESNNTN